MFPFRFGGQARAGPAGVGIGFVEADMAQGGVFVQWLQPMQSKDLPAGVVVLPVQRRVPAFAADLIPTVGQPQLGTLIAAVTDKGEVFAIGHIAAGQGKRLQPDAVTR